MRILYLILYLEGANWSNKASADLAEPEVLTSTSFVVSYIRGFGLGNFSPVQLVLSVYDGGGKLNCLTDVLFPDKLSAG